MFIIHFDIMQRIEFPSAVIPSRNQKNFNFLLLHEGSAVVYKEYRIGSAKNSCTFLFCGKGFIFSNTLCLHIFLQVLNCTLLGILVCC